MEFNMFSKKEILLWIVIFFVSIMLAWSLKLEATEKKDEIIQIFFYTMQQLLV